MEDREDFLAVDRMFGPMIEAFRESSGIDVQANADVMHSHVEEEAIEEAVSNWPDHYEDDPDGMSNFDHSIPPDLEDRLREKPVVTYHAGWNFNSRVWWQDGAFREQIWRYHAPVKQYAAQSLAALMKAVNDEYGWQ